MSVNEPAAVRASRGASLMDEQMPQWYTMVDIEELDMSLPSVCIIGQCYGIKEDRTGLQVQEEYVRNLHSMFNEQQLNEDADIKYGFQEDFEQEGDSHELNRAWRNEIQSRLDRLAIEQKAERQEQHRVNVEFLRDVCGIRCY